DDATVTYRDEEPSIVVTKTANPMTVSQAGGPVEYLFTVANTGLESVTINSLSDDVFGTLAGDADCQVGTVLAPSGSCQFSETFNLPADQPGATHTNVFTVVAYDDDQNEASDSDDATVTYTDVPAAITVTKTP